LVIAIEAVVPQMHEGDLEWRIGKCH